MGVMLGVVKYFKNHGRFETPGSLYTGCCKSIRKRAG